MPIDLIEEDPIISFLGREAQSSILSKQNASNHLAKIPSSGVTRLPYFNERDVSESTRETVELKQSSQSWLQEFLQESVVPNPTPQVIQPPN